jgi:hypothetical protein
MKVEYIMTRKPIIRVRALNHFKSTVFEWT